jgi:N-acetylmuramic acid 6-phosphate etherase
MMIDLQQNSQKLVERSKKIIMLATDKSYKEASIFLSESNGHVKSAILMAITGMSLVQAKALLDANEGFIKKALIKHRNDKK